MKKLLSMLVLIVSIGYLMSADGCEDRAAKNTSALDEQARTEVNQQGLNSTQPPPHITWSLERDNLTKRTLLQNDRTVTFYMYVFIEGIADPIGYYQVNKVSSVNSQLTNTMQIVSGYSGSGYYNQFTLPSPAEDGSYGTNGEGVFGFTPEDIYIEHNMKYITATVPLTFTKPVNRLTVITVETQAALKATMARLTGHQ
jgi:hypothetical protein